MKLIRKNNKEGFTLVELIVVIAILAILALILIPAITGYIEKSNWSSVESTARSVYSAVVLDAETEGVNTDANHYGNDNFTVVVDETKDDKNFITVTNAKTNKYKANVDRNGVVSSDNLDKNNSNVDGGG
ncbi:MAG TPA: prepilin-type N-terminal cleavage/methylation domain-containing protein [Erysipelothrix sp.]|nr:prepilin-type N-terminal cleavage/methylation domain-containing protein [Erysipelothrix sp.]